MTDLNERVAVLETRADGTDGKLDGLAKGQDEIKEMLTKYHGFIGGIAFIASGIPIAWFLLKDWLRAHWM